MAKLTRNKILGMLTYDTLTGILYWRIAKSRRIKPGQIAGSLKSDGYIQLRIDGHYYMAHRIAWVIVHGRFPTRQIDHINGRKNDNWIANLRQATPAQNAVNTTHARGFSWCKQTKRWRAQICINGKNRNLGRFVSQKEARDAYVAANLSVHGIEWAKRKVS